LLDTYALKNSMWRVGGANHPTHKLNELVEKDTMMYTECGGIQGGNKTNVHICM